MTEQNKPQKEFSNVYTQLNEIILSFKSTQYSFMDDSEYEKLDELDKSQYIYWSEIIQRAHFCSITSLQRVFKWISSMYDSWNANNYYGFCASIRGLIESCSDSFYTISKIIYPIAENFSLIEKALNLQAKNLILSEEIENELIHYMFARKLSSTEKKITPETHKALQVSEYLKHIGDDDIQSLYSELCQVSHPSMMSFAPFVTTSEEDRIILHNSDIDSILNENLLERYGAKIFLVIHFAIVPAIGLLKTISLFNAEQINSLKVDIKLLKYINDSDFWKSLENKINCSKA